MGPAGIAAATLGTAAMAYLIVVAPVLGKRRFDRLLLEVQEDRGALVRYYRRAITRGWMSAAIALAIGGLATIEGHDIGLGPPSDPTAARIFLVEGIIAVVVTTLIFRARPDLYQRMARRMLRRAAAILPRSTEERRWFVGVAVSAGIWEEIVYRGFALVYLHWLLPDTSWGVLLLLTSAMFGFAHLYQGIRGVLSTGLAGILLGTLAITSGGLLAPMVVHVLIDLRFTLLPSLDTMAPSPEVVAPPPPPSTGPEPAPPPLAGATARPAEPSWDELAKRLSGS